MRSSKDYRNEALNALSGNWAPSIIATVVAWVAVIVILLLTEAPMYLLPKIMLPCSAAAWVFELFFLYNFDLGFGNAFRKLLEDGDNAVTANTFRIGFKPYWRNLWVYLLMTLKIFLWSLLLIIPGLVKSFSYAMTPYIIVENPDMNAGEAIRRSSEMMKDHKLELLWLYLSFIGWMILSILTIGIGFLWLIPYIQTAQASFYEDLKRAEVEVPAA